MISKKLLSDILGIKVTHIYSFVTETNELQYSDIGLVYNINIYELAHLNLKQWAKVNSVFDRLDWSEEPEQIFIKTEELKMNLKESTRTNNELG